MLFLWDGLFFDIADFLIGEGVLAGDMGELMPHGALLFIAGDAGVEIDIGEAILIIGDEALDGMGQIDDTDAEISAAEACVGSCVEGGGGIIILRMHGMIAATAAMYGHCSFSAPR